MFIEKTIKINKVIPRVFINMINTINMAFMWKTLQDFKCSISLYANRILKAFCYVLQRITMSKRKKIKNIVPLYTSLIS